MFGSKKGFTLVELMVTIVIVGILIASAVPVYHTWRNRAYGSEAVIMLKQLINAEIAYYLEHDEFFQAGGRISIYHDSMDPPDADELIRKNLNISIPQGHLINYELYAMDDLFYLVISSHGNFNLFKNASEVYAELNKDGKVRIEFAQKPDS